MSASIPTADRRPIPAVAIIGNDAVLAAAPATPVQLAHACLRRGFTVAVPASWGDELVAADAVRSLATRDRGPAVMCVCPFVRSRLLAPGPDLAPFLVSLVSPPVATAQYLRAVYGERGVHITYIGSCPSADDALIDAHLTPDAFLADIAEHGIALSEQPLVFDSIVPPDRRRWCSLPGGAPSPEILWSDTDTRTLVEIDRDDISTDLAQHIITREHVLLDLAPSLGCVCSGAISSLSPRSARVAVTALEPPRAFRAVIDAPPGVSFEVPLPQPRHVPAPVLEPEPQVVRAPEPELVESRLDEVLSSQLGHAVMDVEPELEPELDSDLAESVSATSLNELVVDRDEETPVPKLLGEMDVSRGRMEMGLRSEAVTASKIAVQTDPAITSEVLVETEISIEPEVGVATHAVIEHDATFASEPGVEAEATRAAVEVLVDSEPAMSREPEVVDTPEPAPSPPSPAPMASPVRRRTPGPMPARHPASSIPRAMGSDGRALPRAYVAKRRTPSNGVVTLREESLPTQQEHAPPAAVEPPPQHPISALLLPPTRLETVEAPHAAGARPEVLKTETSGTRPEVPNAAPVENAARPEPNRTGAAVVTPESNPSALVVLVVALLALSFFVFRSLY